MWHWDLRDWERGPWIEWNWDGEAPEPMLFLSDTFLAFARRTFVFFLPAALRGWISVFFWLIVSRFILFLFLFLFLSLKYIIGKRPSLSLFSVRKSEREGGGGGTMEESNDKSTPYLMNIT